MRKLHVLTTAGLALGIVALVALFFGWFKVAAVLALFGNLAAMKEMPKYSSHFQFFTILFCSLVTGLAGDVESPQMFLLTLTALLASMGTIGRIMFFKHFSYTGYPWYEPVLVSGALICWLYSAFTGTYSWPILIAVFVPVMFGGFIATGIFKDRLQLLDFTKGGYMIEIGKQAPDFTLPDQDGINVSLSDFRNQRDMLLIFVRGDWCPGCHMMLRAYERERHRFQEKNIMVLAIGPDPVGVNREMVEKLGLDFKVLSDEAQKIAMCYGVQISNFEHAMHEFKDGIPLPASFLVDRNGIVRYVSRPDKVGEFLNPSMIFPIVEKLA